MSRAARIAVYLATGIVGSILLAVVGLIIADEFWPELFTGTPPRIAQGIDFAADHDAGNEFDKRVQRAFSAGTEVTLKASLAEEGFAPGWPGSPCGKNDAQCHGLRQMYYVWGMFPCSNELFVTWTADNKGAASKVTGSYQYVCV